MIRLCTGPIPSTIFSISTLSLYFVLHGCSEPFHDRHLKWMIEIIHLNELTSRHIRYS